ncbi:hypothetical protein [Lysobacter sp. CA199]|uniref:hypothetical protein n=1 Tax=Lysobacter sp. CA199 TaxID=3455608 RepID=UPI003F8D8935
MRFLCPIALCVLLFAQPACADNDFCDGVHSPNTIGDSPFGGRCEVDMLHDDNSATPAATNPMRVHDLIFTEARLRRFTSARMFKLDAQVKQFTLDDRETLIEWSFVSQPTSAHRVLLLTLSRDPEAADAPSPIVLLAQWYAPPAAGWSLADDMYSQQPLAETAIALPPDSLLSTITLVFDGHVAGVQINDHAWAAFPLPDTTWVPARLRNAILTSSPLPSGVGTWISWPETLH